MVSRLPAPSYIELLKARIPYLTHRFHFICRCRLFHDGLGWPGDLQTGGNGIPDHQGHGVSLVDSFDTRFSSLDLIADRSVLDRYQMSYPLTDNLHPPARLLVFSQRNRDRTPNLHVAVTFTRPASKRHSLSQ